MSVSDTAIRVENLSKQYPSLRQPFDKLRTRLSTSDRLRTGRIGGPQARYKTIRESLTEAVGAPFRHLSSIVRNPEWGRMRTQMHTD